MKTKIKAIVVIFVSTFQLLLSQSFVLDSSFNNSGIVNSLFMKNIQSIAIQSDGKIVAAGIRKTESSYNFQLTRYNSNGELDVSFGQNGKVNTVINDESIPYSVAVQKDGKIIVAGNTSISNKGYFSALVQYNVDGSLDTNFGTNGIIIDSISRNVADIALQEDGKIIAGVDAGNHFSILRFNQNGILDEAFGIAGRVTTPILKSSSIWAITIMDDGKIVASGGAVNTDDISMFALAKYISNSNPDSSFGTSGIITAKIGVSYSSPFDIGGGEASTSLAFQADNKIILAGYSDDYLVMARFNPDGTLDINFGDTGKVYTDMYPTARGLALQTDGKIIICGIKEGDFSLTRFNSDGTPDLSFGTEGIFIIDIGGEHDYVECLSIQNDGKIIMAGSTDIGSAIVRLKPDIDLVEINYYNYNEPILIYPNPVNNSATLKYVKNINNIVSIILYDMQGKAVKSFCLSNKPDEVLYFNNVPSGQYILSIITFSSYENIKIIIN